jgi:signal transduction histidine kinase
LHENFNDFTDHQKKETAEIIFQSSKSVFELLENLLQWSRSQRGLLEFRPEKTDINKSIKKIISIFKYSAKTKNIRIRTHNLNDEIFLNIDPQSLNTILRNLISNAIKFTYPDGEIIINTEKNERFVSISFQIMALECRKK